MAQQVTATTTGTQAVSTEQVKPKPRKKRVTKTKVVKEKTVTTAEQTPSFIIKGAEGLSKEQVSDVIKSLFGNDRLVAVDLLRKESKLSTTDAVKALREFWDASYKDIIKDDSFIQEFMPEKCCMNCVGKCGNKKRLIKEGGFFDGVAGKFKGHDCNQFMKEADWIKINKRKITLYNDKSHRQWVVEIENNITRLTYAKHPDYRRSKDKIVKRFVITEPSKVMKSLIGKMTGGFSMYSDNNLSETLKIFGLKPNDGETYSEYMERAQEGYRSERMSKITAIREMDDDTIEYFLVKFFQKCGTASTLMFDYDSDFKRYMEDFFPGKKYREVAISLTVR